MTGPEAAFAFCRLIQGAAAMLLWGGLGYLVLLTPSAAAALLNKRLRLLWSTATVLGVAATLATLPVETAGIGSGWPDALSLPVLRAVLVETSAGRIWMAEAAAAALLVLAGFAAPALRLRTAALAAGLVLATFALTGHAALHAGWLGLAHRANFVLHVLAAGAWLGSLVPLLVTMTLLDGPLARDAATALRRFSTAGHVVVALVLASGALNTALVLGRWPDDLASPYQALLLAKVALVVAMSGLALLNRYRFVPELRHDQAQALARLRLATCAEICLGLGALALVSVFGLLEPR